MRYTTRLTLTGSLCRSSRFGLTVASGVTKNGEKGGECCSNQTSILKFELTRQLACFAQHCRYSSPPELCVFCGHAQPLWATAEAAALDFCFAFQASRPPSPIRDQQRQHLKKSEKTVKFLQPCPLNLITTTSTRAKIGLWWRRKEIEL